MGLKRFKDINERINVVNILGKSVTLPDDYFDVELTNSLEVDVNYDRSKYEDAYSFVANVKWNEKLTYGKTGIKDISADVYVITLQGDFTPKGSDEPETLNFVFTSEDIEVRIGDDLNPMYVESLEFDLVKNTVVVTFGR